MLSGTTVARAILMLVAAAAAIGLASAYWSSGDGAADTPPNAAQADPATRADAAPTPDSPPPTPDPARPEPAPTPAPAPVAEAAPNPPLAAPLVTPEVAPPPSAEAPRSAPPSAVEAASPNAASLDLNQASVAELNTLGARNKLKNVAAFSKAVVKNRPYTSVDELLKRKVINKAKFDRIKDQVTVR